MTKSNVAPTIPFNIFIDVKYHWMKDYSDEATLWVLNGGFNKFIIKFDVISIREEWQMLFQPMCHPNISSSHNLHFGYVYTRIFFVKGCFKLQKVDFKEFSFVTLPIDVVLRLCQSVFKNWCIDITPCFVNQHRFFCWLSNWWRDFYI
jgi:hypothetical protein